MEMIDCIEEAFFTASTVAEVVTMEVEETEASPELYYT